MGETDNVLRFNYGDGVSAIDRSQRAIVMLMDGAIGQAGEAGYSRDEMQIEGDGLPLSLVIRGRHVYTIDIRRVGDTGVNLFGRWMGDLRQVRNWWGRLMLRLRGPLTRRTRA